MFGVPQSQWQQLSHSERQQVIRGYNQRQKIQEENAPLNNAIGAATGIIKQEQRQKHWRRRIHHMPSMPSMPPPPKMPSMQMPKMPAMGPGPVILQK